MVFFPTNKLLPFSQKSKDNLLPKNTHKDNISGIIDIIEKDYIKYDISSERKIKDDKKIYSFKYA